MRPLVAAVLVIPLFAALGLTPVDEAGFQKLVASHKGKVVLYDFWATWCEPCRAELPQLIKLEAKLHSSGFELVTISADEPEQDADAAKALKKIGWSGPAYRKQAQNDEHFIDAVDRQWGGALPALFLYDRNGRKVRSFIGETDMGALEAAIRKVL